MGDSRRVAPYARVSTDQQSVVQQLEALREVAARAGWQFAEEYVDRGISGAIHSPHITIPECPSALQKRALSVSATKGAGSYVSAAVPRAPVYSTVRRPANTTPPYRSSLSCSKSRDRRRKTGIPST